LLTANTVSELEAKKVDAAMALTGQRSFEYDRSLSQEGLWRCACRNQECQ